MKRTPFYVATALLLIVVMTSPSTAGGAVKLSGVQFSLGSLIATGTVTGLGGYTQGVTAELTASGTPVVTSSVSSLPEVVGDAAVLVDPHNTNAIAYGILQALMDDELRADLRRKGLARVQHYSWERSVRRVREIYEEVATR